MKPLGIAICRVSTPEQRLSNSLNRQEESVIKAASELDVEIVKWWSGDVSSKVGRNVNRKDLTEAFGFCKNNRGVKFLFVDEVDRFMRSTAEMFYWIVKFKELGVRVYFSSNPELNGDDAKARLFLSLDGFKSEGSNEERQHKSIVGHEKAIREGRYTFPPKPGYAKGTEPGVHVPHPVTFKPLQKAFREVLSGLYTPTEACKRLRGSEFGKVYRRWDMDKFRHFAVDPYYAGILEVDRQVKATNPNGKHQHMLSVDEHDQLVRLFRGTQKFRGAKKQYNPEFPMNKIMACEDCGSEIKFTGAKGHSGFYRKTKTGYKQRAKVNYYWKYRCRGCGRAYHRVDVHSQVTKRLKEIRYNGNQENDFVAALETVWRQRQKDKLGEAESLQKRLSELQATKSRLVVEMVSLDSRYRSDIEHEIDSIKTEIESLEKALVDLEAFTKEDLPSFVKFGLTYSDKLADDWWELDHDERVRCQQLLFPGGITFNSAKKVGTPKISPIYSLKPNKKDLRNDRKSLLVELEGITPSSDW